MLQCKNVTCVREEQVLFNELSFTLSAGEIIHLEGVNGVGKTSLFRLLVGLSSPYSGDILWRHKNIAVHRESYYKNMLYLGHKSGVKPELTAIENLQFFYHLYHAKQNCDLWEILAIVGLAGYENVPAGQLSAGQQRRIALARLWFTDCLLWILDEPFTAIDKKGVAIIERLLLQHTQKGGMVILTSHQSLSIPEQSYQKVVLQKTVIGTEYV